MRIPAGNYQPEIKDDGIRFYKPSDVVFPSWRNVVPENIKFKGVLNLEDIRNGTKSERDEKFSTAYCSFLFDTGMNVNLSFLKDLPCTKWKIFTHSGRNQFIKLENVEDKNQFAVFVPLAA